MRIKILSSAVEDLYAGRLFYEMQVEGVGAYFFDSLSSDIDSLALYAGIHPKVFGLPPPPVQTIPLCRVLHARRRFWQLSGECSTYGGILTRFGRHLSRANSHLNLIEKSAVFNRLVSVES